MSDESGDFVYVKSDQPLIEKRFLYFGTPQVTITDTITIPLHYNHPSHTAVGLLRLYPVNAFNGETPLQFEE